MPSGIHYPAVTVDVAVFRFRSMERGHHLEVLLVERGREPFAGRWALPGGFVEEDEELDRAAARELLEETGMEAGPLIEEGVYGRPGRDPRGRTFSVAYLTWEDSESEIRAGDDAARAGWFPVSDLPPLAFDHFDIIDNAVAHLQSALTGYDPLVEIVPPELHVSVLNAITCNPPKASSEKPGD